MMISSSYRPTLLLFGHFLSSSLKIRNKIDESITFLFESQQRDFNLLEDLTFTDYPFELLKDDFINIDLFSYQILRLIIRVVAIA